MLYDSEDRRLTVDLTTEAMQPSQYLEYPQARSIRWDDCAGVLELPDELNQLGQLEAISVHGRFRHATYPSPRNLEAIAGLKSLALHGFCDFADLPVLRQIEELYAVVREPLADARKLVESFPNLRKLEIRGSHLKSGELPPEIGELSRLEYLELVSCGLTALPGEFARLQALRTLRMRGLPMREFPEVICELSGLEELEFKQSILKLPESFAGLSSLRKLNFTGAFNDGTMSPVNFWSDEKVYLRPVPAEIGRLPALQDLDLSMCGLEELAFLKNAAGIKRFRAQYSALKNCDGFAAFTALEELNLESADALDDIAGLAGLPIARLKLAQCDELRDLSPILELPRLALLNIEACSDIESLDPAYRHPTLETLLASEEVLEQWKRREEIANLRPIEELIGVFESAAAPGDARALAEFRVGACGISSCMSTKTTTTSIIPWPVISARRPTITKSSNCQRWRLLSKHIGRRFRGKG